MVVFWRTFFSVSTSCLITHTHTLFFFPWFVFISFLATALYHCSTLFDNIISKIGITKKKSFHTSHTGHLSFSWFLCPFCQLVPQSATSAKLKYVLWEQELSGRENKMETDVHTVCMLSEGASSKSSAQESIPVPDTSKTFMSCSFCCFSMMGVHSSQKHERWCFLAGFFSEEQRWQNHMEFQFHVSEYLSCFKSQKAFQPLPHTFKYKMYIVFHLQISWRIMSAEHKRGSHSVCVRKWGIPHLIILNFILYPSFHHHEVTF